MVGRIYLAKIYFTDLSEYKIRPVVVIREYGDDSVCLPLTSNLEHDGIVVDSDDLGEGYLKKESKVIFPKCFTLHRSILIKHIATVKAKKLSAIHDEFCKKMGCGRGAKTSEFAHGSSLMPKPDRVEISLDPINQTREGQRQVRASAGIQSVAGLLRVFRVLPKKAGAPVSAVPFLPGSGIWMTM